MTLYEKIKKFKFMAQGIATFLPSWIPIIPRHRLQFTSSRVRPANDYNDIVIASYTYFFRYLVSGGKPVPNRVAEIGPGDSLAFGICALLCGANEYYPIDDFKRDLNYDNMQILDILVSMLKTRHKIPDDNDCPKAWPRLESYDFPEHLVPDLDKMLDPERMEVIRSVVRSIQSGLCRASSYNGDHEIIIEYPNKSETPLVDLVVSSAVMEHVDYPKEMYERTFKMLVSGGRFAHAIGLNSHGTASQWNGHWCYSDFVWAIIRGRVKYLINRWPASWHVKSLKDIGFKVDKTSSQLEDNKLQNSDLAKKFKNITADDLLTYSFFVGGFKP